MQELLVDAYIAGPDVFFPHAEKHFAYITQQLAAYGVRARVPVDGGLSKGAPMNEATALAIADGNYALIDECHVVLANMNPFRGVEPDSGTSAEVGYAKAKNKPVVTYIDTPESYAARVRRVYGSSIDESSMLELDNRDGCIIENFGLPFNLMMACRTNMVTTGLDDAIKKLVEVVKRELMTTQSA
jgi:nucleoside 2-deoxyribosyltransferase